MVSREDIQLVVPGVFWKLSSEAWKLRRLPKNFPKQASSEPESPSPKQTGTKK